MPISEKVKALIRSAWDDGAPCLLATQGPNGPNVSPKGSMLVFDDDVASRRFAHLVSDGLPLK